jgi:hypothetical protein
MASFVIGSLRQGKSITKVLRNAWDKPGIYGTEGGSRTRTGVTPMDFESVSPCDTGVC